MEASRRSDVPDHLLDKLQENLSHAGMAEDTLDESNCVVNDRVNQTLDQDVLKSVEQAVNALDFLKNNSSPTGREESATAWIKVNTQTNGRTSPGMHLVILLTQKRMIFS